MKVNRYELAGVPVVCPHEALTQADCAQIRAVLEEAFAGGPAAVVLDLAEVPFIDSAGLEMLCEVSGEQRARGGHLKLASCGEICEEALRITDLRGRFEVFGSLEEAAASVV